MNYDLEIYRDELDDTEFCPLCGCIVDGDYCPCEEECEQASCQHRGCLCGHAECGHANENVQPNCSDCYCNGFKEDK